MSELSLSPILTSAGLAAVAAAHGQGLQAKITHIALGDGGYAVRDASNAPLAAAQARTAMQSEQVRVTVYAGAIPGPQQIVVEARIDAGKPNFWVKEVGFFLEDGTLFAIWSSDSLNLGFRGDLVPWVFRFALAWTQLPENAVTVEFSGDAGYSDLWGRLSNHITSKDPHPTQIEPAFRTDCEPCLLEFAEPGENLPAPFVFSRGGKSAPYIDALGNRRWTEPDDQADDYDPVTLEYRGKRIDAYTTTTYLTRQMWSGATPGIIGEGGVLPTGWHLSNTGDIQTEIVGIGYDKGFKYLDIRFFGTPNTPVFRLANPNVAKSAQGEKWTCQIKAKAIAGSFNNIDKIGIGIVEAVGPHVGTYGYMQKELAENFQQIFATRTIVETDPSLFCWFAVFVPSNNPIDITLRLAEPQVEKSVFPGRFVGADTGGASVVLPADVLTIGPIERSEPALVPNGDFASDLSLWSQSSENHWVWQTGKAYHAPTSDYRPFWINPLTKGKRYRVTFDLEVFSGSVRLFIADDPTAYAESISWNYIANGTYSFDFTAKFSGFGFSRNATSSEFTVDNVKITELIPFEVWDSDADGHTILLDSENPLAGQYAGVTSVFELSDGTTNNLYRMYQAPNSGALTVLPRANGADVSATYKEGAGLAELISVTQFNEDTLRLTKTGSTNPSTSKPTTMPAGLCQMRFGYNTYLLGWPLILKRFAVYNRYLPEADLNAMVQK
ncbi:phage tail protein [Thalassospira sp. TSL5-1]|uniref:phage tail-collar fiber domain-containing protein n=1 Tax=Thalassospira sp. TSL5-1 TaxID=1544451 RepID=UPI00093994F1|nr:phage tail protein [Thalassospira sp. TSL5-1]OKH88099.1 hypothetical protein LF95_15625 [Thalassospira sp. TSL5-1]